MQIRNILAVRNDRFGEFLLNIPAFNALKRNYAGSRLVVAVSPYVKELAGCIESVDEVITLENRKYGFLEVLAISRQLKKQMFDLCVILNPSKYVNAMAFFAGVPVRAGYNHKAAFLLTRVIKDEKYLGKKHEIEYNLELAGFSVKGGDKSMELSLRDDIITTLTREYSIPGNTQILALHPWTSDNIKQWPLENFKTLAIKIARELNTLVVVIGGTSEENLSLTYFTTHDKGIINLTGKTTLIQLGALLKRSKVLISGDSGPVHLASCVGTCVIALFRNDMPEKGPTRWGPRSPGSVVIEKSMLSDITVEEVFTQAKLSLGI